uniref:NADH-ubiquinone oxidoreductase chain 3 n=1 Tax=Entomoneis sp. TaxID=186043 RepID=A0A3G1PWB6_9STRA|nr:NADH dehydrogenase subunit 3 [Entomoneis sp.]
MLLDYFSFFVLVLVSCILAVILVIFSYIFVLEDPDSEKLSTYECGYEPYENSRHVFNIRFFLIAILFVIFDIEMLFLIPWCVSISNLNLLGFWSVIDFIFELGVGFFYVWYTNSLNWK